MPFIVMELLEGERLSERIARSRRMSPAETCQVVLQIARALGRAHDIGVVHRDLKPGNVFLVQNEDETVAKVLDFGIAKWQPDAQKVSNLTGTNVIMGPPYYMSPEQLAGARFVDHRTDLWALAVIAFECLTGSRPFLGENMMAIAMKVNSCEFPKASSYGGLSAAADAFFTRALSKKPDARFQSARELSEELRRATGVGVFGSNVDAPQQRSGTAELTIGGEDAAGASNAAPSTGEGPSSRTVTAVNATPPERSPTRPSRAPWLLGGAIGLVGLFAGIFLSPGQGEPVQSGMASAAGSVLKHAAKPPSVWMPSALPVAPAPPAASNVVVAPVVDVGATVVMPKPAAPVPAPPVPVLPKPAAPKVAAPKPAAQPQPASSTQKKSPAKAPSVFDSRR
jgi:serine/threonine-protein kinase